MRTYLRVAHHHHAREDDVRDALAMLDAAGTTSRRKGPNRRHKGGEFITPGPDWLWCCDGHDKFRNYGIGIYACVDAYSRRIQWCYVGNSNRRAVSILRQAATAIKEYGRCPSFWRSDRGKEVLLLADAQYSFFLLHKKAEAGGLTPEEEDSLKFRDCYMFGTSTANVKIESTWMRMILHQTRPWLVSSSFYFLIDFDALPSQRSPISESVVTVIYCHLLIDVESLFLSLIQFGPDESLGVRHVIHLRVDDRYH